MSPIDRIAHTNRWRDRSLIEKAVLGLGLLVLALALPPWPTGALVLAVATVAAVGGARVPAKVWGWTLAAPAGFVLTGAATLLVEIGPHGLALTPHGPEAAAALTVRSLAAMSGLLFLALTTPATDLVAAGRRLGIPADITEIALLTYRFLFLLADTALAMNAAQGARLGHVGVARRIRSAGLVVANLLPRALDRARRLEVGLSARGWTGSLAVLAPERPLSPRGLAVGLATLAAIAAVGILAR